MIAGIVLAGGKSSRMGRPKALLPIGSTGETFLDRIANTLLQGGVEEVVVVVGADAAAIRAAARVASPRVRLVDNPDFERGQLSSLIVGLATIDRPGVSAALVTLIDSPLISRQVVSDLIRAHRTLRALIARPVAGDRHGHPVIFDRELFEELRHADPEQGAKAVLRAHAADILEIGVTDEGPFIDIDTHDDYERWIGPLTR